MCISHADACEDLHLSSSLAVSLALHQAATHRAAEPDGQSGPRTEALASLLANAAEGLARCWLLDRQHLQCSGSAAAAAAAEQSGGCRRLQAGHHRKGHTQPCWDAHRCCLVVQHLTAAVAQFAAWQQLRAPSPHGGALRASTANAFCDVNTLTLLAQKLQSAALSVSTVADAAGCCLDTDMAAGLWLQALVCRCAAAVSSSGGTTLGSNTPDPAAATAHALQAAKAYFRLACKRLKAAACSCADAVGAEAACCQSSTDALGCIQAPAQKIMQLAACLALELPDSKQPQVIQQFQSTLRCYCRLRCAVLAGGRQPGHGRAAAHINACAVCTADSSTGAGQLQALCSALQLVASATAASPGGGWGYCGVRLDRLCWLEGAALAHVASAAAGTGPAAAALHLLQDLTTQASTELCQAGQLSLHTAYGCMASGKLLLLQAGSPAAGSDSRHGWLVEAQAMFTKACQCFAAVLQLPCLTMEQCSGKGGSDAARLPAGSEVKQRGGTRRKGRGPAAAAPAPTTATAAAHAEAAAAPGAAACAALCHCLLGQTLAQQALCGGSSSSDCSSPSGCAAAWSRAGRCLHDSIAMFKAAGLCGGSSADGSGTALWWAQEAAVAVTQAWHIAGLQDWQACQEGCVQVLQSIAASCDLEQASLLLPVMRSASQRSWLSLLVQPLPAVPANAATGCRASGVTAQQLPECLCQLQEHCRGLKGLASVSMQEQQDAAPGTWQLLQQVRSQLAAAEIAAWAGDNAVAAEAAEVALLQCRSVLGMPCPGQSSRHKAGPAHQALSLAGGAHDACIQWQALGLYMSGLWVLAGVLETSGNPQDAVRTLKQLLDLAQSAACYSFAALAQARLSSCYSRMGQSEKAAAAVACALELQQSVQELSGAAHLVPSQEPQPSSASCLTAASVVSAQAAVALGRQQAAAAQECLQAGLSDLNKKAHGAGGLAQLGWRCVQQYAQLLLQLAQCHVLLHNEQEAVAILHEGADLLTQEGQPTCRRYA